MKKFVVGDRVVAIECDRVISYADTPPGTLGTIRKKKQTKRGTLYFVQFDNQCGSSGCYADEIDKVA